MFTVSWLKPHHAGIGVVTTPNLAAALELWHVLNRTGRRARVWTRGELVK